MSLFGTRRLEVGDRILNIGGKTSSNSNKGKHGTVEWKDPTSKVVKIRYDDGEEGSDGPPYDCYRLIKRKTNIVTMISIVAKKILDEKTRKFIKAGFLDESLNLTDLGRSAIDSLNLETHKDALSTLADEVIAEKKEEKCG